MPASAQNENPPAQQQQTANLATAKDDDNRIDYFRFRSLPDLPVSLKDASVGKQDDLLLVLGGLKKQATDWKPNHSVYILRPDADKWQQGAELDYAFTAGATVSTPDGLICIDGRVDGDGARSVHRFRWENDNVSRTSLADLPYPLAQPAAALIDGKVYVLGSCSFAPEKDAFNVFLMLDPSDSNNQWQQLEAWPGPPCPELQAAVLYRTLYLFAGGRFTADTNANVNFPPSTSAYAYTPGQPWKTLTATPREIEGAVAAPCGDSHILMIGGAKLAGDILAYHTITDTWTVLGQLPVTLTTLAVLPDDTEFTVVTSDKVIHGEAFYPSTKYGIIDHSVVVAYVITMILIGVVMAKREKNTQDYFRGGRRIPWWASGLSIFATGASAISLMAMPGKAYAADWAYFTLSIYALVILPLALLVYVPMVRRLNVATANEYLERRYSLPVRFFGSLVFSLNQMLVRMASIMLLPAIALSAIIGMPIETSIIIMGVVTTIYVTLGGLEGVIWTDVTQAIVMLVAVSATAIWALTLLTGDATEVFTTLQASEKLHMFNWSADLTNATVLVMFACTVTGTLGMIGDQNFIQRVQCTKDERQAKKAVITALAVAIPLNLVLFTLGTILYLFYKQRPDMLTPAPQTDGIYPLFAAQNLPPGLAGLVVASLLAATMSTLSSAINSVANIGTEDFYRRIFGKHATDRRCLILGRCLSLALGAFGTCAALVLARSKMMSVWDLATMIGGIVGAPIAGIFALGVFTKRANSIGVTLGGIAAIASTFCLQRTNIHPFLFLPVGIIICIVVGYLTSLLIPHKKRDQTGLTIYSILAKGK